MDGLRFVRTQPALRVLTIVGGLGDHCQRPQHLLPVVGEARQQLDNGPPTLTR